MNFYTERSRNVIDRITFTLEEFIDTLNKYKPKEIFNYYYSSIVPCWTITEYLENGNVKYFAQGWAHKNPVEESMDNLYKSWLLQGLDKCYINVAPSQNNDDKFDEENYKYAKMAFTEQEGREPNMNNTEDSNIVSAIQVGITYARLINLK